jgi:hypothetical protein
MEPKTAGSTSALDARPMGDLPPTAAWRHIDARIGFEVVFLRSERDGYRFDGHTTAVEDGVAWSVHYAITLDASWATRSAHVSGRTADGVEEVRLERRASGVWEIDGTAAPSLDGCLDVDLEASAFTNAFPVHRLALSAGQSADAPAAYVRAPGLAVERLEQTYLRLPGDGKHSRYDYAAPAFDYRAELVYDEFGLVLEYPGLAVRVV